MIHQIFTFVLILIYFSLFKTTAHAQPDCKLTDEQLRRYKDNQSFQMNCRMNSNLINNREVLFSVFAPNKTLSGIFVKKETRQITFTKQLPYAVYLHGRSGDANMLAGDQIQILAKIDSLTSSSSNSKSSPTAYSENPFLIFAPSGENDYWVDSAQDKSIKWGEFLNKEIEGSFIDHIEREFNVLQGRAHRALFGFSMGGYGTLSNGLCRRIEGKNTNSYSVGLAINPIIRDFKQSHDGGAVERSLIPPNSKDSINSSEDSFNQRNPLFICENQPTCCLCFDSFYYDLGRNDVLANTKYPSTKTLADLLDKNCRNNSNFQFERNHTLPLKEGESPNDHQNAYVGHYAQDYLNWMAQKLNSSRPSINNENKPAPQIPKTVQ